MSTFSQLDAKAWCQIAQHAAMIAAHLEDQQRCENATNCENTKQQSVPVERTGAPFAKKTIGDGTGTRALRHDNAGDSPSKIPHAVELRDQVTLGDSEAFVAHRASRQLNSNMLKSSNNSECVTDDVIEKMRQKDREKKRKSRITSTNLIQELDKILLKFGHGDNPRTLHDTLKAACTIVQTVRCDLMMRQGMLSRVNSGLLLVNAENGVHVVQANEFILARIAKPASAVVSAPLSSIFSSRCAGEASAILRHLMHTRSIREIPQQFVLGINLCNDPDDAELLSAEFLRCLPSSGGRPLFIVNIMPSRPLVDPALEVLGALRRLHGFRPEETCVTFVLASAPIAWASSSRANDAEHHQNFRLAVDDMLRNSKAGNDLVPVAAPWALDFLLRGVLSGEWGGLREWLVSNGDGVSDPNVASTALRALEILSSSVADEPLSEASIFGSQRRKTGELHGVGLRNSGHTRHPMLPGMRLEVLTECGIMVVRLRIRGLCIFEFKMGSMGILPTVPLPSIAQSRLKAGAMPLEEALLRDSNLKIGNQMKLGVREDGAVWGHFRPSADQFVNIFGQGGESAFHCSVVIEKDFHLSPERTETSCSGHETGCNHGKTRGSTERPGGSGRDVRDEGFRFSHYLLNDRHVFATVRRWVRAGATELKYPEVGGLEMRNALLEMYYAMRVSQSSTQGRGSGQVGSSHDRSRLLKSRSSGHSESHHDGQPEAASLPVTEREAGQDLRSCSPGNSVARFSSLQNPNTVLGFQPSSQPPIQARTSVTFQTRHEPPLQNSESESDGTAANRLLPCLTSHSNSGSAGPMAVGGDRHGGAGGAISAERSDSHDEVGIASHSHIPRATLSGAPNHVGSAACSAITAPESAEGGLGASGTHDDDETGARELELLLGDGPGIGAAAAFADGEDWLQYSSLWSELFTLPFF